MQKNDRSGWMILREGGFLIPYIKYRGAQPPDSIRDFVAYEDPSAPCREGLARFSSDARRFAESKHKSSDERANAIRQYFADHTYSGLDHVGGVGFVEKITRPMDEEISEGAYQQARIEIEKANAEYRARKADLLAKNNDPSRRATALHEQLGWRTRIWVASYTEMQHHVPYSLGESSVAYLRARQEDPSGLTLQLIDIYHKADGRIDQALLEGTDWAEVLVDLLALAGYGAAELASIVGTMVPFCKEGEAFEVATFGASIMNTPVLVRPEDLNPSGMDEVGRLALRHLRDGLSAPVPTAAFAAFWNALERQAEEEARTKNLKHTARCECGRERTIGFNTKRGFETMYAQADIDPGLFDRHRGRRGVIQHGAKLRTTTHLAEVLDDLSQVQIAATVAVAKKVGIRPRTITYLSGNWPVAVFKCTAQQNGSFDIQFSRMSVRASAGFLPQAICGDVERTIQAGLSGLPTVDPLALPPVAKD